MHLGKSGVWTVFVCAILLLGRRFQHAGAGIALRLFVRHVHPKLQGAELMYLALAAYATYVVNAGQFILKLRAARLDQEAKLREEAAAKRQGFQGVPA